MGRCRAVLRIGTLADSTSSYPTVPSYLPILSGIRIKSDQQHVHLLGEVL
ncbi:MAG: hypothetical protein GY811_29855 [Myxococcales bacterium]|nr:hypothetical protein [Myxococcales bacterium]